MKIGIFDSGMGGLIIMRQIVKRLPQYDYIYLGDCARLPYGTRSPQTVYEFTRQAVEFLFRRNCVLVILACNTASSHALRRLQRQWLPKYYPDRRILGVVVPAIEEVAERKPAISRLGILATAGTVASGVYPREIRKIKTGIRVYQQPAPLLVPLIEAGDKKYLPKVLADYAKPLVQKRVDAVVLGCTHYPIAKSLARKIFGLKVAVISQDEFIPGKLFEYLKSHPEMEKRLSRRKMREFLLTDLSGQYYMLAKRWFGKNIALKLIKLK